MAIRLYFRRGLSALWSSVNPVLSAGEPGYETDTGVIKVGDGTTAWSALPAIGSGGSVGGGVTDHGALTGLADDDHPQYHTDARAVPNTSYNAKGDIVIGAANDSPSLLSVGVNGTLLSADSAQPLGVRWRRIYASDLNDVSTFMQNFLVAIDEADARGFIGAAASGSPVPVTSASGAHTLTLADGGAAVEVDSATPVDVTIPLNSSVAFPVGAVVEVYQRGAGQVSIVGATGVTIESRGSLVDLAGQYAVASLRKRDTDTWVLAGDLS